MESIGMESISMASIGARFQSNRTLLPTPAPTALWV